MKSAFMFQMTIMLIAALCQARHHFEHHGGHHEDRHRHHHRHHPGHPQHGLDVNIKTMGTPKNETISIDVTRKLKGENDEKSTFRVNLRVHVIQGVLHINGHKIDHSVVTSVHIRTLIAELFHADKVMMKPAMIQVRVMVTETSNANGVKMLAVQEEIVEVEDDEVDQIEVKEVLLELGDSINESKRTITVVKIANSKIHNQERTKDKHVWACKGRLPKNPFSLTKDEMRRWKHRHPRPPVFETGANRDGDENEDGDEENEKDGHHGKHGHGKHHHHHGPKYWSHRFCRWFHKLPIATRALFSISVILFGILMVASCWACCCRKPKRKPLELKYELDDAASVDLAGEEEPLPLKKKPLDEQPLVA